MYEEPVLSTMTMIIIGIEDVNLLIGMEQLANCPPAHNLTFSTVTPSSGATLSVSSISCRGRNISADCQIPTTIRMLASASRCDTLLKRVRVEFGVTVADYTR